MNTRLWAVSSWLVLAATTRAFAAGVPVGFSDVEVARGFTSPTALTSLPDGRVLVVQQDGVIRVVQDDALLPESFWEVPDVNHEGERGCLGITPDPDFATNHYVYVYCTLDNPDGTPSNHLLRVTEVDNHADPDSEEHVLILPSVTSIWHMGGALRFAPDGTLYIAVGNHEDNPVPVADANSQNLENPFGKILRINKDGSVPADNPFVDEPDAYAAILSYGYRNPFAFDIEAATGRVLVGDVGQSTWEEINDNEPGANYGWPVYEGPSRDGNFVAPLYAYTHDGGGCSITGGAFYDPPSSQFPAEYTGTFLFQDFCAGTIEVLDLTSVTVRSFVTDISFPTNLEVAADGSIYYLSRNQDTSAPDPGIGTLSKISYNASEAPRIARHPASQTVVVGEPASFEVVAEGADSLQWQRDGVDIAGATASSYTLAATTADDDGAQFVVIASNGFGAITSRPATLTITTNRAPSAEIVLERGPLEYAPGAVLSFVGSARDPEDGALPDSAFTWQVDFHHDIHTHPLVAATSGASALSFGVPEFEASQANTWLRVHLTVQDSEGGSVTVDRDVYPATQLSSLSPLEPVENGWGPYERDRSNGEQGADDGQPLAIGGIAFPKGLGVHAPSALRFALDSRCSGSFLADIGVDDEVGDAVGGTVVFQVYLDGALAYDSGVKRGADPRTGVSVPLVGASELRLVVADAGDGNGNDHADWGGARITGCDADAPSLPSTLTFATRDLANATDWSFEQNLNLNDLTYGDRNYHTTDIPQQLRGVKWIRPANDSKWFNDGTLVQLSLPTSREVIVALNDLGPRPDWVDASWTLLDDKLGTDEADGARTYSLYSKTFAAGTVELGAWGAATSTYVILLPE